MEVDLSRWESHKILFEHFALLRVCNYCQFLPKDTLKGPTILVRLLVSASYREAAAFGIHKEDSSNTAPWGRLWANLTQADTAAAIRNHSTPAISSNSKAQGRMPWLHSMLQEGLLIWASKLLPPHKQVSLIRWQSQTGWVDENTPWEMEEMAEEWGENFMVGCVVGRHWKQHLKSTGRFLEYSRKMGEKWMEAHWIHRLTSSQYSLWLLQVPEQVIANGTRSHWHSANCIQTKYIWKEQTQWLQQSAETTLIALPPQPEGMQTHSFWHQGDTRHTWLPPNDTVLPCKKDG